MAPTATAIASPPVPPNVLEFVQRNGVAAYLSPVLAMTKRLFAQALTVNAAVEEDPEIPSDTHVVIHVCLPAVDAEQYAASKFKWSEELFRICPAPVVCAFRCRLKISHCVNSRRAFCQ